MDSNGGKNYRFLSTSLIVSFAILAGFLFYSNAIADRLINQVKSDDKAMFADNILLLERAEKYPLLPSKKEKIALMKSDQKRYIEYDDAVLLATEKELEGDIEGAFNALLNIELDYPSYKENVSLKMFQLQSEIVDELRDKWREERLLRMFGEIDFIEEVLNIREIFLKGISFFDTIYIPSSENEETEIILRLVPTGISALEVRERSLILLDRASEEEKYVADKVSCASDNLLSALNIIKDLFTDRLLDNIYRPEEQISRAEECMAEVETWLRSAGKL
jgi:hypothetical protein